MLIIAWRLGRRRELCAQTFGADFLNWFYLRASRLRKSASHFYFRYLSEKVVIVIV